MLIDGCDDGIVIGDWARVIFDSLYDGVLIIDAAGVVRYVNPSYTRITAVEESDIVGKPLAEARPGSHLPTVVATGVQELGVRRKQGNAEYMVNMVPICRAGVIIGGISILNEVNDVYRLVKELDRSNRMIQRLKDRVRQIGNARYSFDDIVSNDARSQATKDLAARLARKDVNLLILGESGTGKELYAQSIHNASQRRNHPFLAVNCAALDPNLLESELFGYEDGSFTGARKGGKIGLFEEASGGTLFLDEIGELDVRLQAKLLRALQEGLIRPVGGASEVSVDVRVMAATNKDIETLAKDGSFRRDLYYRVATFTLILSPLRERRGDITPLVQKFTNDIAGRYRAALDIDPDALAALEAWDWPGNVRELKNTIEYAAIMAEDGRISARDLPPRMVHGRAGTAPDEVRPLSDVIREAETAAVDAALRRYGQTVEGKRLAAEALGISLATLYNKLG